MQIRQRLVQANLGNANPMASCLSFPLDFLFIFAIYSEQARSHRGEREGAAGVVVAEPPNKRKLMWKRCLSILAFMAILAISADVRETACMREPKTIPSYVPSQESPLLARNMSE